MADFEIDHRGFASYLRTSPDLAAGCLRIATQQAAVIAARTPVETGATAASTHAEPAQFRDRVGAYVVQEGAGVQTHFGNARTRADHHATRGF